MIDRALEKAVEREAAAFARVTRRFEPAVRLREEGWVLSIGDGIATLGGLPNAASQELLAIDPGARALVLGLDPGSISAVVLDDGGGVRQGARVRATGHSSSVSAVRFGHHRPTHAAVVGRRNHAQHGAEGRE